MENTDKTNKEMLVGALPDFSVISVQGPDAADFLNTQLTCEVRKSHSPALQYGTFCNPKGRIVATFWLLGQEETFRIVLPGNMVEIFLPVLARYVLRSKVSIENSNELQAVGFIGSGWQNSSIGFPLAGSGAMQDGYLAVVPRDTSTATIVDWHQNGAPATLMAQSRWDFHSLMAGLVMIRPVHSGQFVPQHLSLDKTEAVSFSKGCFPGQEVIARMHYRGRSKQQLALASSGQIQLMPATDVYGDDNAETKTGSIINSCPRPDDGSYIASIALAVTAQDSQAWAMVGDSMVPMEIIKRF